MRSKDSSTANLVSASTLLVWLPGFHVRRAAPLYSSCTLSPLHFSSCCYSFKRSKGLFSRVNERGVECR